MCCPPFLSHTRQIGIWTDKMQTFETLNFQFLTRQLNMISKVHVRFTHMYTQKYQYILLNQALNGWKNHSQMKDLKASWCQIPFLRPVFFTTFSRRIQFSNFWIHVWSPYSSFSRKVQISYFKTKQHPFPTTVREEFNFHTLKTIKNQLCWYSLNTASCSVCPLILLREKNSRSNQKSH